MTRSKIRIVAIDPGTLKMGLALLEGRHLRYHGVEVLPARVSPHQSIQAGRKAVMRLIRDFRPEMLAMEKTFVSTNKRFALLNALADEITALSKRRGLRVVVYAPSTIKKHVAGHGHASKQAVATSVAQTFPELAVYLSQDRKWKARHHANMFDAVATGLTALDRL